MPLLANEVMDEASGVYLNDAAKTRWTYPILLPYLRSAYFELQSALEDNDLPPLREVSAVIQLAPNTFQLPMPENFILPLFVEERSPGESRWQKMDELDWEPDATPDDKLNVWVFREGIIQFLGATTTREVRLRYVRSLSTIATENSVIEIANAKGFLAARTAGLASSFGGRATERGTQADSRANLFKKEIISSLTKRMQDRPVRRRGYPFRRFVR